MRGPRVEQLEKSTLTRHFRDPTFPRTFIRCLEQVSSSYYIESFQVNKPSGARTDEYIANTSNKALTVVSVDCRLVIFLGKLNMYVLLLPIGERGMHPNGARIRIQIAVKPLDIADDFKVTQRVSLFEIVGNKAKGRNFLRFELKSKSLRGK